jgi:hypothetical protein
VLVLLVALSAAGMVWLTWPDREAPGSDRAAIRLAPRTSAEQEAVRDVTRWLVDVDAMVLLESEAGIVQPTRHEDIPAGEFDLIELTLDDQNSARTPLTDADFIRLRQVRTLRRCIVRALGLSDEAFGFLANNPDLTWVELVLLSGTDTLFEHVAGLSRLEELRITASRRVTGSNLANAAWLNSIQTVDLTSTSAGDAALRVLADCPNLVHVNFTRTPITDDGVLALRRAQRLRILWLPNCGQVTEEALLEVLPALTNLQQLCLSSLPCGDATAEAISRLPNLHKVDLGGTRLTDAGLARLAGMPSLRRLELDLAEFSREAIAAFKEATPKCDVGR